MVWHRIQAWLYPNHLKNVEGTYIARTNNNRTLNDADICTIMKTRIEIPIRYEDLLNCIRQYNEERAYQICDGFAVTNDYYVVYPNIGGSFDSVRETHNHEKNKVTFRISPRAKLRNLAKHITVDILGIADTNGYIDTFTDYEEDAVNSLYVPGDQFAIHGSKIRATGDDPGIGVYLVPVDNPSGAVKITRIAQNNPSMITGIIPSTGHQFNRIEIRTQYSGSSNVLLKVPRIITSTFTLEEA
jgi:hypothetical protein